MAYKCRYCGRSFKTKNGFDSHIKMVRKNARLSRTPVTKKSNHFSKKTGYKKNYSYNRY